MGTLIQGRLTETPALLPGTCARVAVLHTGTVTEYATAVAEACARTGREVIRHVVSDGEAGKRLPEAERAWQAFAAAGLTREDAVVAVGGGALTDAAGYFAAAWLRGIAWVAVPTTTLGMVDAAHGGKVAVNTPAGKNLVGAFHEPAGVLLDAAVLATLPARDLRAGMVEAVKCAWLAGEPTGDVLGADRDRLIAAAVRDKRELVRRDPFEHGDRIWLNYGHTLGHAVETASGYTLRHGEAVAVGMVFAAELAERLGIAEPGLAERHRAVLEGVGVPTRYPGEWSDLEPYLRADKKRTGAGQRWVLLEREGSPVVTTIDLDEVRRAVAGRPHPPQ